MKKPLVLAALVTVFVALGFFGGVSKIFGGNTTAPFYFGDKFHSVQTLPLDPWVGKGPGYDG